MVAAAAAAAATAAADPAAAGLAYTGSDALPWGLGGILTVLAGAVLLVLAAQRRRRAS
jgi:CHASE1-domain containing sensor protein